MMYLIASDFNDNPDTREAAGSGLLLIISIYVALNFLYFLVSLMAQLRGPLRRIVARLKNKLANNRGRGVIAMRPLNHQEESTIMVNKPFDMSSSSFEMPSQSIVKVTMVDKRARGKLLQR
jgi:hypothetical protein